MTAMPIYVDNLTFALGERTVSVEESADAGRTISDAELLKEAGFQKHHMCGPDTSAYDLAKTAVEKIKHELAGIDAIVYSTCLPHNGNTGKIADFQATRDIKHLMDFPASHLQADFHMDGAQIFGLNQQACTGMLGSLRLAKMLLHTEEHMDNVLCVTADRFPEGALYEQAYNLISDGAAGCTVSRQPSGFRLIAGHGITNGAMAFASDDETIGSFFNYSYKTIQQTLQRANLTINDIDWIVPQNTNGKAWQILANLLRFPMEKVFFPTLPETGHVISGDNIINLSALCDEAKVSTGQRVMLFMAGYGLNWQCLILEKA
jgi:3-oxoacyl-[acyl-carrier-protein] synthase III